MIVYTVVWLPTAQAELADLWTHAVNKRAVTDAANRIDRELRIDPETKGQPYDEDWLLVDAPLEVIYTIRVNDCIVEVLQVLHQ